MLIVKTWCLPGNLTEEQFTNLHNAIVAAVKLVPSTEVKSENDMLNLFPPDMMRYGLGQEIKMEILDVPFYMDHEDRIQLAVTVGKAVKSIFPDANVDCVVRKPDPRDGSWSSKR